MPTPNVSTGLVSQWLLDGDGVDNSGSFDVTENGSPVYNSEIPSPLAGVVSQSVLLDGVDDYFEVSHQVEHRPPEITVAAWVRPATAISGPERIVGKDSTNSGNFSWSLQAAYDFSQNPSFAVSAFNSAATAAPALASGAWCHLVGTYDGVDVKLYKDGTLVQTRNDPGLSIGGWSPLRIGRRGGGSSSFFDGNLSDIRVYNRAISDSEVSEIYSGDYAPVDDGQNELAAAQLAMGN